MPELTVPVARAAHDFTARLPRLTPREAVALLPYTTATRGPVCCISWRISNECLIGTSLDDVEARAFVQTHTGALPVDRSFAVGAPPVAQTVHSLLSR